MGGLDTLKFYGDTFEESRDVALVALRDLLSQRDGRTVGSPDEKVTR